MDVKKRYLINASPMTKELSQEERKAVICAEVYQAVLTNPDFAMSILGNVVDGLADYRRQITKKNSNIHLIVMNLKPEYLEKMKEFIIPEVFESLGIRVEEVTDKVN